MGLREGSTDGTDDTLGMEEKMVGRGVGLDDVDGEAVSATGRIQ